MQRKKVQYFCIKPLLFFGTERFFLLKSALCGLQSPSALGAMRIVVRAHNARGATFARLACASTDSASLGYLRPSLRSAVQKRQIAPCQRKRHPKWVPLLWRRRRDLNSRAGYPTYALSRGASSANLSTSP